MLINFKDKKNSRTFLSSAIFFVFNVLIDFEDSPVF
jgi:hypothetical protein